MNVVSGYERDTASPPVRLVLTKPAVMLVLTVYKRFRDYAEFQSSLVNIVYSDSMLYILCITGAWNNFLTYCCVTGLAKLSQLQMLLPAWHFLCVCCLPSYSRLLIFC